MLTTTTAAPRFDVLFGAHARLEPADDGVRIWARGANVVLRAPGEALSRALARLADGGATEDALTAELLLSGDPAALFSLVGILRFLDERGALQRRALLDERPLATLTPASSRFRFDAAAAVEGSRKLSRFAYLRTVDDALCVESPLGSATVELHDARAAAVALALARPCSRDDLDAQFPELAGAPLAALLTLLENARALVDADDAEGAAPPDGGSSSDWWEFHDLLFHMRTRRGRHDAPYGGTYRGNSGAPPPLVKPRLAGETITLPRPYAGTTASANEERPFTAVLHERRSLRTYGPEPLTIEQLGVFLYHAVRYQAVREGDGFEHAVRAAPAGGALHELEVYPVVARCRGLDPGVYHYRPLEHELTRIAEPSPLFERLLDDAWTTANRESPLNVYFQITARTRRVFWKYESMAYALILKNLGALYATMYLVATALDLAPCALGGGDSELFAALAQLDPCEEPAVGEFVLGSRA
jgi:SagB-type dehydrogenase family enzyme